MPGRRMLILTGFWLGGLLSLSAFAQVDWAHDSHLIRGKAVPDTFYFSGVDDLKTFFEEAEYTLDHWIEGDRSIPRYYLASVPSRWRHEVAPNLPVKEKKQYFFFVYAPLVLECNEDIMAERQLLTDLAARKSLSADDQTKLRTLAHRYLDDQTAEEATDAELLVKLEDRVDIVPPSLALAQAAVESGWSTSRFSDLGNALFGQWTWKGDGITPSEQRDELGNYRIKSFDSPEASIAAYMHNLNTHRSYAGFRQERAQMRQQGKELQGSVLAATLTSYSEKGQEYVETIQSVIRVNQLPPADSAHLRDMQPVLLVPVGEGAD